MDPMDIMEYHGLRTTMSRPQRHEMLSHALRENQLHCVPIAQCAGSAACLGHGGLWLDSGAWHPKRHCLSMGERCSVWLLSPVEAAMEAMLGHVMSGRLYLLLDIWLAKQHGLQSRRVEECGCTRRTPS